MTVRLVTTLKICSADPNEEGKALASWLRRGTSVISIDSEHSIARQNRLGNNFAEIDLVERLRRPPWHVASTAEIADATAISFGRLSNWVVRKQFVLPEPRDLFRVGNRRVYRLDRVVGWLSGVTLEQQARRYLGSLGLLPNARDDDIWLHIRRLEGLRLWTHFWEPRTLSGYLATIR